MYSVGPYHIISESPTGLFQSMHPPQPQDSDFFSPHLIHGKSVLLKASFIKGSMSNFLVVLKKNNFRMTALKSYKKKFSFGLHGKYNRNKPGLCPQWTWNAQNIKMARLSCKRWNGRN